MGLWWKGGLGGRAETRPTLLIFHLRLFGQKEEVREEEWEWNKENANAEDEKGVEGEKNKLQRERKKE